MHTRIAWLFVALLTMGATARADDFYTPWEKVLEKFTFEKGGDVLVDYQALKADRGLFDQFVATLAKTDPDSLKTEVEQRAFWINAYNVFAVKACLDNYPVKSINDLGNLFSKVWDKKWFSVNGTDVSLGHIEHEVLRKKHKDPRIHAAIVCASHSCPNLSRVPYRPATLEAQLDLAMIGWIKNPKGSKLDRQKKELALSSIFKWFAEDLNPDKAPVPESVVAAYPAEDRKILADPALRVSYMDYDWSLNDGRK